MPRPWPSPWSAHLVAVVRRWRSPAASGSAATPTLLPDPVRDALVGDEDTRVVARGASTRSSDATTARSRDATLADAAIAGHGRARSTTASRTYFTPKEYAQLPARAEQRVLRRRHQRRAPSTRAACASSRSIDESPAERGRAHARATSSSRSTAQSLTGARAGQAASRSSRARAGTDVTLTHRAATASETRRDARRARRSPSRSSPRRVAARRRRARSASSRWRSSAPARTARSYAAIAQAAQATRRQGLRASTCAATAAASSPRRSSWPARSSPTARSSRRTGARCPTRTLNATGDPVARHDAARRARRPRHARRPRRSSPARCRTATARQLVGTRTFGKGVFQEVIELSNGGALDITAGQYFTPERAQPRRRRATSPRRRASQPDDAPRTRRRDEALDAAPQTARGRPAAAQRSAADAAPATPRAATPAGDATHGRRLLDAARALPRRPSRSSSAAAA